MIWAPPLWDAHPSIAFLLRAWSVPTLLDLGIISGLGLVWAGALLKIFSGMYVLYRERK